MCIRDRNNIDLEENDEERKGRVELWLMDNGGWNYVPDAEVLTNTTHVTQDHCQGVDQGFV